MIANKKIFGSKINEETELGTDGYFLSPGPQFLYLTLDEEIRLKLLQSVANFRKDTSKLEPLLGPGPVEVQVSKNDEKYVTEPKHISEAEGFIGRAQSEGYKTQHKSLSDGEMYMITDLDPFVNDIVSGLVKLYAKNYMIANLFFPEGEIIDEKFNFSYSTFWLCIMKSGDFHSLHSHANDPQFEKPDSIHLLYEKSLHTEGNLSGAIYLDIPENLPYPQGMISWMLSGNDDKLSSSMLKSSPESGEVYVWPSWIQHMVYPFRSEEERIMISFNGYWEYKIPKKQ